MDRSLTRSLDTSAEEYRAIRTLRIRRFVEKAGPRFVLFGAGYLGRVVSGMLAQLGQRPLAVVDNSPAMWGNELAGVPIVGPDELSSIAGPWTVIITVFTSNSVRAQLERLGVAFVSFPEFLSLYEDELLPWFSLCHPEDILSNVTGIVAASELWADCRSREEFRAQVDFRLTFCSSELPSHERASDIYFPPDLVRPRADDVFVDCGACAGETTAQFIRQWNPSCHQVIAIEPDPENFSRLTETITLMSKAEAGRIRTVQAGLASRRSVEHFQVMGNVTSKICAEGTPILCQPLDDILGDSVPTYIKMDIEGAEAEALKGASRTIRQHKPSLAVCLYHRYDDLWNIPLLIKQIEPAYRLYLRRYSDECWEQVLYAVPASFANGRES